MATFTTNTNKAADFSVFDLTNLIGDYVYDASPTLWRTGPTTMNYGVNVAFQGTGFTYSGGNLVGGTITAILTHQLMQTGFQITGMSMSVASFNAFYSTNDAQGFLEAAFSGADTISGSKLGDKLYGYAGADTIEGFAGNDILDGGTGSDTLIGGEGSDTYIIDSTGDKIQETGSGPNDNDKVDSSISVDLTKAAFDGIEDVVLRGTANLNANGDDAANSIRGNTGDNKLSGGGGFDVLYGLAGNDTLDGGSGNDQMRGGSGNDTYYVDNVKDLIMELEQGVDKGGHDKIFSSVDFHTGDQVEDLTLTGTAIKALGGDLDNTLTGNAMSNYLDGMAGSDTLIGGAGNDWYFVDNGDDVIVETSTGGAADYIFSQVSHTLETYVEHLVLIGAQAVDGTGNTAANTIQGNNADNKLDGAAGNDDLRGGGGNDTLIGGAGNDALYGGAGTDNIDVSIGDDTAYYAMGGIDVIHGFDGNATGGQDKFNMDAYFDAIGVADGDRAERLHISKNGGTADVWLDYDGDGSFDFQVAEIHSVDVIKVNEDIVLF